MWGSLKEMHHRQKTKNKVEILRLEEMVLLGIDMPVSYKIASGQQQGIIFLPLYFMFLLASKDTKSRKNEFLICFKRKLPEGPQIITFCDVCS